MKTLSPIVTFLDACTLSCITEFSPIYIPSVPIKTELYQIDDLKPADTLPKTVALGATKSVASIEGFCP